MMADDSRSKRILSDLTSALRRDPQIDEFDFICCLEPFVNRSPVVLENHKLGLETWSIKVLFAYVYNSLLQRTGTVRDLKSIHEFSCAALLINPECYTIWNLRKQLVTRQFIKADDDLKLATLIQTKHPKSPETFIQRRWLLIQLFPSTVTTSHRPTPHGHDHSRTPSRSNSQNGSQANGNSAHAVNSVSSSSEGFELTDRHRQAVQYEMEACKAAADRYPSNYNAWSHRMWVLQRIANIDCTILEKEWESTKLWVQQHISDHSGFNYRQFLLKSLSSSSYSRDRLVALIKDELSYTADLIQSFPGHEAIWYHRRSVIHLGKCYLQVTQEQTSSRLGPSNNSEQGDDLKNGHGHCQQTPAASCPDGNRSRHREHSSHSSPPRPKTAKTDAATDAKSRVQKVNCPEEVGLASLIGTKREVTFTEMVYKKTNKSDRPLQHRCIEHHKRWLNVMQY